MFNDAAAQWSLQFPTFKYRLLATEATTNTCMDLIPILHHFHQFL